MQVAGLANCHEHVLHLGSAGKKRAVSEFDAPCSECKKPTGDGKIFKCVAGCDYGLCEECWKTHKQVAPKRGTIHEHALEGKHMRVVGLHVHTERNGHRAVVEGWNEAKGAWLVQYEEDGVKSYLCEVNLEGSVAWRKSVAAGADADAKMRASIEFEEFEFAPETSDMIEMRITTKKSAGFYTRSAKNFLLGMEDKEGKKKEPVETLIISGLGAAINAAAQAAAAVEKEGIGKIKKTATFYPQMQDGKVTRGCARISITIQKTE